ncbi:glutamate--cysteine ligase [Streptomyces sp. AV19]|uniref:carboxylate-amine ligase n=1 Tax=Streptomyces sp. AV19 TaxID=2793068 RepID=UPI0018FF0A2A|nr:glutamate--cysteine ligase [Streptomyces sp. AV19]MBH1936063.1 glutamate--cysteine ligase [Streptomyces sp. AV19]MDG4534143.1 glutamate--cysteine ligase [Streptomyces sp. AV19]
MSSAMQDNGAPVAGVPTFGVEEEFFLADEGTRATVARAADVIKRAHDRLGDRIGAELFTTTVETRTRPVGTLDEMRQELRRLREGLAVAAEEGGCRVVASGTPVVPFRGHREIAEEPRYRQLADRYGPFVSDDHNTGACACHVHVAVSGREEAVRLCNHLRPWLPVLQTMAANSPFNDGRDSGFASWRALHFGRWPHVGPTPPFRDAAAYDDLVDSLITSGMLLDRKHVYWYARPSEHWPTLEVRVPDVNADLDVVLLVASLTRALVAVLKSDVRRDVPPPGIADPLLRAAHWRAARDGLRGSGLDPLTGRLHPAAELVERLVARAAPALDETGELPFVRSAWHRLRTGGGGAELQRAAYARRGDLRDVVDVLSVRG